jgi:replicative DNA helicase
MAPAGNTEKLLISSIIRNRDMTVASKAGVTADMFIGYQDEWNFVEKYFMKHRKLPSLITFKHTFPSFQMQPSNDTSFLCEELKTNYVRRLLTATMRETADLLSSGNVDGALEMVHTKTLAMAAVQGVYNDGDIFRDNADIMDAFEATRSNVETTGSAGIPLGFPTFDARTGGAKPGDLIVIGARLGQGKSWWLQHGAASAAAREYSVVFNSLEMSRSQVAARIFGMIAGPEYGLRTTNLTMGQGYTKEQLARFTADLRKKMNGTLHVSDRGRGAVTALTVAAQIERHQPDLMVIDYIQLMGTKGAKDHVSLGELSGELKGLGVNYGIPIMVASQLNRAVGVTKAGTVAGAEGISGSDGIGQDADTIVNMSRLSKRVIVCKCVKNRHGEDQFSWYVHFDPDLGLFEEITFEEAMELKAEDLENSILEQEKSKEAR